MPNLRIIYTNYEKMILKNFCYVLLVDQILPDKGDQRKFPILILMSIYHQFNAWTRSLCLV